MTFTPLYPSALPSDLPSATGVWIIWREGKASDSSVITIVDSISLMSTELMNIWYWETKANFSFECPKEDILNSYFCKIDKRKSNFFSNRNFPFEWWDPSNIQDF